MPDPVYDPTTPAIAQDSDWNCAITATRWGMTAFGRHPSQEWMEATSLAEGIETKELGLMDGSGAGLAAWITKEWGEFGYSASNVAVVAFDDVRRVAGSSPVLIGGHDWCHWTGVRSYDSATDTLALANPADHYMDVGQTLNRQQFAALGPFSMVVIRWGPDAPPPPPPDVAALQQQVADLQAQVAALQAERSGHIVTVADIADRLGDQLVGYAEAIKATVGQMQAERAASIGPRPS